MTIPSSGEHRFLKVFCKIKISVSQIQILVYLVKKKKIFISQTTDLPFLFFFVSEITAKPTGLFSSVANSTGS